MPWPPPNFTYPLNCQWLACLSICASDVKGQQPAKLSIGVSKSTYLPVRQSDSIKRTCNGSHCSNTSESLRRQYHEDELDILPSKEDERSSLAYPWINATSVLTSQSTPAMPTLLDKTYKRAARGTALALYVSIFLYRRRSSSPNYFRKSH